MNTDLHKDGADALGQLITRAGPRKSAPPEMEAQIRAAAYQAWRRNVRHDRQRRYFAFLSAAAVACLVVAFTWRFAAPHAPAAPAVVATLAQIQGDLQLNPARAANTAPLRQIYAGDELDALESHGARLTIANALSLRLAPGTRLRWLKSQEIQLLAGAIYVDSGPQHATLFVRTPYGVVSHLGTRYQVRALSDGLSVAVRQGAVQVTNKYGEAGVQSQQQLRIDGNGQVQRTRISPFGKEWEWADALAPGFQIDNRTLEDVLNWAADETGRRLEYADAAAKQAAERTVLHGSDHSLTPAQALAAVLLTTDFEARFQGERLIVSRK